MPPRSGVGAVVDILEDFGVINRGALDRFAEMLNGFQTFTKSFGAMATGAPAPAGRRGRRRKRRARVEINPSELKSLYANMTAKELAEKYGVSVATINKRISDAGLSKRKRGGGKKAASRPKAKKASKPKASKPKAASKPAPKPKQEAKLAEKAG